MAGYCGLPRGKYLELLRLYISVTCSIAYIMIGRLYICGKLFEEIGVYSFLKRTHRWKIISTESRFRSVKSVEVVGALLVREITSSEII